MGGVGLQGDLRSGGQGKALAHRLENQPQALRSQQTGGASAEIDRGKLPVRQLLPPGGEGIYHGGDIGVHAPGGVGAGVEIAVGTLAVAKGNVYVKAQHSFTSC